MKTKMNITVIGTGFVALALSALFTACNDTQPTASETGADTVLIINSSDTLPADPRAEIDSVQTEPADSVR